jgi:hypothetical protein
MTVRRFRGWHLGVVLLCGLPGAAAALGGTDLAMAEALFQEGRKLVDQKRFAEACPKFAESQRLDPGIGTLLNLASCHELEGRTATAWTEFTQAVGLAEREGRSDAQQFARTHLAALTPKLPKVVIQVPSESDLPGLEVSLDGQVLGRPAFGLASPIDPGAHVVAAVAPGKKSWKSDVSFGAAEQKTVTVPALEVEPPQGAGLAAPWQDAGSAVPYGSFASVTPPVDAGPAAVEPPIAPPVRATSDAHAGQSQRAAGLVIGGAGLIAVGAGVVLGFMAKSKFDESADHCSANLCDLAGLSIRDSAVTKGQVATAVFAFGAGTAVAGAVLWFTAPTYSQASRGGRSARVGVTPGGVVVSGPW